MKRLAVAFFALSLAHATGRPDLLLIYIGDHKRK